MLDALTVPMQEARKGGLLVGALQGVGANAFAAKKHTDRVKALPILCRRCAHISGCASCNLSPLTPIKDLEKCPGGKWPHGTPLQIPTTPTPLTAESPPWQLET